MLSNLSGYSTDPISSRVKNMIEREYINLDIQLDKEHFGNIAIYVRKVIM